jgi:toluene monooxygenase electron transfer component
VKITVAGRDGTRVFTCGPGEKLLHAGLRGGVALPYECASGTCGSCKARLVVGRVESAWPEAPGGRACKDPRELLTCQSVAQEDCALEVGRLRTEPVSVPRPKNVEAVLRRARRLTHDVMAVEVELEEPLDFEAGQFALVTFPGVAGARAYSMASFQAAALRLSFVVKRKPGGRVSDWLFDGARAGALEGAPLSLFAPLGHAVFQPELRRHLLCIAGGSGLAGIVSILYRAEQGGHFRDWRGHVFFGVRGARDAFHLDELQAAQTRFPARLEITVALSDEDVPARLPPAYPGLSFARGLVHDVALARMAGRFAGVRAYLAGPKPMVEASLRGLLREARLTPADIRYDKFN